VPLLALGKGMTGYRRGTRRGTNLSCT
jgi:hypothetical protein